MQPAVSVNVKYSHHYELYSKFGKLFAHSLVTSYSLSTERSEATLQVCLSVGFCVLCAFKKNNRFN